MTSLALIDLENLDIGFIMFLDQMENLTNKLIVRGYLPQPRSWRRQAEYAER